MSRVKSMSRTNFVSWRRSAHAREMLLLFRKSLVLKCGLKQKTSNVALEKVKEPSRIWYSWLDAARWECVQLAKKLKKQHEITREFRW